MAKNLETVLVPLLEHEKIYKTWWLFIEKESKTWRDNIFFSWAFQCYTV